MKTILTLLMAVGTVATLQAQSREETRRIILGERKDNERNDNRNNRDVVYGRSGHERYPDVSSDDRRYEAEEINQDYDNKINSIRNNRYLSNVEKERTIRQLEQDRQRRLAEIDRSYNDRDHRYDDDRYARRDNGKHKGWYKKNKNKNWKKGNRDWRD